MPAPEGNCAQFSASTQPGSDHFSQQTTEQATSTGEKSALTPVEAIAQAQTEEDKSIAVLPFTNRSPDANDAYFTDGVHDDLLTHISRIGTFKTISRTSVMKYRDTTLSIPKIAQELDAARVGLRGESCGLDLQIVRQDG